ncbi:MAG: UvrD-helicase domain-containing protein, partial [Bdellovibrionales bacterium]|nr:UvrD-helicase domain-containing protein [Bdellovibrionales bacterium]
MSSLTSELSVSESLSSVEIVRAGAGAGKTTKLVSQVFDVASEFKKKYERLPQVVVCTFTRKATQELRERLTIKSFDQTDFELVNYVSSSSHIHISTIHGVLHLFLSKYGHLLNLDNDFQLINDSEAKQIRSQILLSLLGEFTSSKCLHNMDFSRLLNLLSTYYKEVYFSAFEPVEKNHFYSLLNQVSNEWGEKFIELSNDVFDQTDDEKWTSFSVSLRSLGEALTSQWTSENSLKDQIEGRVKEIGRKPSQRKDNPKVDVFLSEQISEMLQRFKKDFQSDLWNENLFAEYEDFFQEFKKLADKFCLEYLQEKVSRGKVEMDDLEILALRAIELSPEVVELFSKDWDYWLIDEFQDTSPRQVKILNGFIGDRPHFFVGDPQQSIYLFRGARSEVFEKKLSDIDGRVDGKVSSLQKNYRSTPKLLEFFNELFGQISSQFVSMLPKDSEEEKGPVAFLAPVIEENQDSTDQECRFISSRIDTLLQQGCNLSEICILGRTNKELTLFSQYLRSKGLPVHVHVSSGFFNRREVKDLMILTKFLVNPYDNYNFLCLLRAAFVPILDKDIFDFYNKNQKSSVWNQALERGKNHEAIVLLRKWIEKSHEQGLSQTLIDIIETQGLVDVSFQHDVTGRRESNIWKFVLLLREQEHQPGFNILKFIDGQLAQTDLETSQESDATASLSPDSINLMTIHGSKGLQFEHVFVPRLHKKPNLTHHQEFSVDEKNRVWSMPIYFENAQGFVRSLADQRVSHDTKKKELNEFERIFYVALTRAKKSINLSWNQSKLEKDSWAEAMSRINWLDLQPGVHKKFDFSYEVVQPQDKDFSFEISSLNKKKLGLPLAHKNEVSLNNKYSVTQVLQKNEEFKPKFESSETERIQDFLFKPSLGVLIHAMMERLKYNSVDEVHRFIESQTQEHRELMEKSLNYVLSETYPPLLEIIKNGFVEWGFQLLRQDGILEGQIDLWGVSHTQRERKVWIVDYKSGSEKYLDKAFEQLKIYSEAVKQKGFEKNIYLAVV